MKKNRDSVTKIQIVLPQGNILQELAPREDCLLNPQIEEYLLKQSSLAKITNNFELITVASDEQKALFSKALKNTFMQKILVAKKEKRRSGILAFYMFIMGAMFLSLSFLIQDVVAHEILLVASWVFLWGAIEMIFFERRGKQLYILRYQKFMEAKII